jgi:hypothetical protein
MAWETANTVTTIVSSFALISSLGSYWYTNHRDKSLRKAQFKREQWHEIRDTIKASITLLNENILDIESEAHSQGDISERYASLRNFHRKAIRSHSALCKALGSANKSEYASRLYDWADLGHRPRTGEDTATDVIGEIMNGLSADNIENEAFNSSIKSITSVWGAMIEGIEEALRCEAYNHDPEYQKQV